MDFEVRFHAQTCGGGSGGRRRQRETETPARFGEFRPLDQSEFPTVFSQTHDSSRQPLAYQAPPHVEAFGLDAYPYVAALKLPTIDANNVFQWQLLLKDKDEKNLAVLHGAQSYGHGLLLVPRLEDGVYVLLGEEDYEAVHEGDPPERPGHRFVGASRWAGAETRAELVAYSRALGHVLGHLHFALCLDGFGFSVVGGHEHHRENNIRLYVQCDARWVRALTYGIGNDNEEDTVDRLSFILGRLAYVPNPRQADLFHAFAEGYVDSCNRAGKRRRIAEAVLEGMSVYLE